MVLLLNQPDLLPYCDNVHGSRHTALWSMGEFRYLSYTGGSRILGASSTFLMKKLTGLLLKVVVPGWIP